MKVLVIDQDGKSNGAVVANLVKQKNPNADVKLVASTDKTVGRSTNRKVQKLAKSVLGLSIQASKAEVARPEDVQWADKIIIDNSSVLGAVTRTLGQELPKDKTQVLGDSKEVKTFYRLKKEDSLEDHMKKLADKVSLVAL